METTRRPSLTGSNDTYLAEPLALRCPLGAAQIPAASQRLLMVAAAARARWEGPGGAGLASKHQWAAGQRVQGSSTGSGTCTKGSSFPRYLPKLSFRISIYVRGAAFNQHIVRVCFVFDLRYHVNKALVPQTMSLFSFTFHNSLIPLYIYCLALHVLSFLGLD